MPLVSSQDTVPVNEDARVRSLHPGMGQAVAERTVLRKVFDLGESRPVVVSTEDPNLKEVVFQASRRGIEVVQSFSPEVPHVLWRFETWDEVADRVATGNASLLEGRTINEGFDALHPLAERLHLKDHISRATVLMSGRHLQQGDEDQAERPMELFANCATAATSAILFQLLLSGSGVGRCYDDDMMLVDWDDAPTVRCVIDEDHPDYDPDRHESARDARHKYADAGDVLWFDVPDSREGWAKALEMWETAAFERVHKDKLLILDFSGVRPRGAPIKGMQGRPSSGPAPLMTAFARALTLRGTQLPRWKQGLYVDHIFAECVLVGGARRSARMSTKTWRDESALDFIRVKRPIEYDGMSWPEVLHLRNGYVSRGEESPHSFLWSSNNSVAVDRDFWDAVASGDDWACRVFDAVTECSYADGTGEPGFINVDKLVQNDDGWDDLYLGDWVGSSRYHIDDNTRVYLSRLARRAKTKPYHMITNPCGEITLNILGGYCVLADVAPYHADDLDDAEEAYRIATRALIRTNLMESIYGREVARTNRIGVCTTGIHEFAWRFFRCGFRDLLAPDYNAYERALRTATNGESSRHPLQDHADPGVRAMAFWLTMKRFSRAVRDESVTYSEALGVVAPHTCTSMKPSGTISKLFGLTEGAHLPAMARFLRWVQFRDDDPLVDKYSASGYPVRVLQRYKGHTVVGFPTRPVIDTLGMGDAMVLAGEATMEEQYRWLGLLEHWWLEGDSIDPDSEPYGNQISYTMKYSPGATTYEAFREIVLRHQPTVKCCTVMPQEEAVAFEYQPEEPMSTREYERLCREIDGALSEDVDHAHVVCGNGSCAVEYGEKGRAYVDNMGAG